MSRLPQSAAHVVQTNHLPALAAAVMTLLAACATAGSGPTGSSSAGAESPSPASIAALPSASPTARPVPTTEPLPTAAHRAQTIHVVEDPIGFATIPVAGCTNTAGCVGQQLNGRSAMFDGDRCPDPKTCTASHARVGTLIAWCVMTDPSRNLYDCAITITLTGRGDIVFNESVVIGGNGPQGPWPILSGTGEFVGATGSVAIPADSICRCGEFVIAITG